MRISIIGHAGSGKSTLARKISEKFSIPNLQIDKLWFESGGNKLKMSEREKGEKGGKVRAYIKEKVEDFIKQDSWVSDGWYPMVQAFIAEKADLIIFLDISFSRRLFNHIKRIFKTERHKELTKWDDIRFVYKIVSRTFLKDLELRQFVHDHTYKVKTFKNFKEVENYFNML